MMTSSSELSAGCLETRIGQKEVYLYLAPKTTTADGLAFGIATDGIDGEQRLVSVPSPGPSEGWTHVAVVLGASSATLYVNGELVVDTASVDLRPEDLGDIDYAWLGRSQFAMDPTFDGAIDEVRIYDRALVGRGHGGVRVSGPVDWMPRLNRRNALAVVASAARPGEIPRTWAKVSTVFTM